MPVADQTSRPDDLEKRLRHAVKSTCDLADILHVQIVHGHTGDPPTVGEKQAVAGVKAALDNLINKLNVLFSPGN
ncbi:unnamed protein product [Auanema sp. JU1783]|nr:unnamed protein product [Auanema sp. JU1783]